MGKNHLKILASPKTWHVKRKGLTFIAKPAAGPYGLNTGMPLNLLLRQVLVGANTAREVKKLLNFNEIKIDGKIRRDPSFCVGIFDTIELATDNCFRVILNERGKLGVIKVSKEETSLKPCKITGKTMVKGRLQLNLFDGKNILVDDNAYKIGDTIILTLPELKISKHLPLSRRSTIFLAGGKHIGEVGMVEDIVKDKVFYKNQKEELIETSKKYAFVVGEDKPLIALK
ncbi:MAG: 30S ribosomal protein S4e [Nanoarchaeota archaeon]